MPYRQRPFGRFAKFTLGTTASSGQLLFTLQEASWIDEPRSSTYAPGRVRRPTPTQIIESEQLDDGTPSQFYGI